MAGNPYGGKQAAPFTKGGKKGKPVGKVDKLTPGDTVDMAKAKAAMMAPRRPPPPPARKR